MNNYLVWQILHADGRIYPPSVWTWHSWIGKYHLWQTRFLYLSWNEWYKNRNGSSDRFPHQVSISLPVREFQPKRLTLLDCWLRNIPCPCGGLNWLTHGEMPFVIHLNNYHSPTSKSGLMCHLPIQIAVRFRHYLPISSGKNLRYCWQEWQAFA